MAYGCIGLLVIPFLACLVAGLVVFPAAPDAPPLSLHLDIDLLFLGLSLLSAFLGRLYLHYQLRAGRLSLPAAGVNWPSFWAVSAIGMGVAFGGGILLFGLLTAAFGVQRFIDFAGDAALVAVGAGLVSFLGMVLAGRLLPRPPA